MNRELNPVEERALARQALDDENLFDTLIARGAVEMSLEDPAFRARLRTPNRRWRAAIVMGGVAAAAAGLLTFLVLRPSAQVAQKSAEQARGIVSKPAVTPAILLTADLQPARSHDAPVFRGVDAASRPPKLDGSVVSIEHGVATLNLGSLDGVARGTELPVKTARILITTVFRDHARGKIVGGDAIRTGDPVRVPNAIHLAAVLEQVNALAASGNLKGARNLAQQSLPGGAPGEARPLLERLAALDYQAGASDAARDQYEVVIDNFEQPPAASPSERAETLANYGALLLMNGDRERAGVMLQKALAQATSPALRSQTLNNLGAIAQTRGDRAKAADYYRQALAQNPSKSDRDVVQANLARIANTQHP
jgi:hypothetical protein